MIKLKYLRINELLNSETCYFSHTKLFFLTPLHWLYPHGPVSNSNKSVLSILESKYDFRHESLLFSYHAHSPWSAILLLFKSYRPWKMKKNPSFCWHTPCILVYCSLQRIYYELRFIDIQLWWCKMCSMKLISAFPINLWVLASTVCVCVCIGECKRNLKNSYYSLMAMPSL